MCVRVCVPLVTLPGNIIEEGNSGNFYDVCTVVG